jgi:DNA-binding NtrC family response regulator
MRKLVVFQDADAIARDLQARMTRRPPASIRPVESAPSSIERWDDTPILEQVTKVNRQAETDAILAALVSTRWNRKQAAAILKIDYKSLLYKMKKLGMDDRPAPSSERAPTPLHRAASGN